MEREIANIDEFQMDENETPILPAGLREEECLYVLPTGVTSPAGSTGPRTAVRSFMSHPNYASSNRCLLNSKSARDLIAR